MILENTVTTKLTKKLWTILFSELILLRPDVNLTASQDHSATVYSNTGFLQRSILHLNCKLKQLYKVLNLTEETKAKALLFYL